MKPLNTSPETESEFIKFLECFKRELEKAFGDMSDIGTWYNVSGTSGWLGALIGASSVHMPEIYPLWDKLDWWASDLFDSWLIECAQYIDLCKEQNAVPDNALPVQLDPGAYMPERAHSTDAGLDLRSPIGTLIPGFGCATIDTGVHVQLPPGSVGMLKSKSGLNVKHGLTGEGVIDEGYTGSITVKLYNHTPQEHYINKGDKISQLVILPVLRPTPVQVDKIEGGERGDNGFGSTGR